MIVGILVVVIVVVGIILLEVILIDVVIWNLDLEFPDSLAFGKRRKHHGDLTSGEPGIEIRLGHGFQIVLDPVEQLEPEFLVSHLPPAELQLDAEFVAVIEKALGAGHLDAVIVFLNADAELDFLELAGGFDPVLLLLGLIVFEFSVIDDAADGWIRVGGDLHEVEPQFLGLGEGLPGGKDDAEVLIENANFGGADAVVDARGIPRSADGLLWLRNNSIEVGRSGNAGRPPAGSDRSGKGWERGARQRALCPPGDASSGGRRKSGLRNRPSSAQKITRRDQAPFRKFLG